MPTTEAIREFYDGYLSKLDKPNTRHQFICNTFDTIIMKDASVLDIGCGTGITSKHLAGRAKFVVGIDLSPILIEHALRFNSRPNLQYFVADITEWTWPSKFDFISMVDVFEHIPIDRLESLMDTIRRLSHDRTEIYVNIPTGDVLRYLEKNRPEIMQIVDVPHDDVVERFRGIGFMPAYFKLYWSQYVEYLFRTESSIMEIFNTIFKPIDKE